MHTHATGTTIFALRLALKITGFGFSDERIVSTASGWAPMPLGNKKVSELIPLPAGGKMYHRSLKQRLHPSTHKIRKTLNPKP